MSIQPDASLTAIGLAAPISTAVGIVLNVGFYIYLNRKSATVFNKMVDYLKKALIYGHISRISS